MIFIGFDPVGKTLEQVMSEEANYRKGVAVFLLGGRDDTIGERVDEDFSLRMILKNHPEIRGARVVQHNDFFGESVFRIRTTHGGFLVEVPDDGDTWDELARFCADLSIRGYIISSVSRAFDTDTATPRVGVLSSKEYKNEVRRLMEEARK